jgi:hypothetical protein
MYVALIEVDNSSYWSLVSRRYEVGNCSENLELQSLVGFFARIS